MQQRKPGAANPLLSLYSPASSESPKKEAQTPPVPAPAVQTPQAALPAAEPPKAAAPDAVDSTPAIKPVELQAPAILPTDPAPAQIPVAESKPAVRAKLHGVPRGRFSRSRKKAIVSEDFNRERKLTVMLRPEEDEDLWDLAWAEGLTASSFVREVLVNYLERHKNQIDRARDIRRQLDVPSSTGTTGKDGLAASA
jgi:hypothetical protein